jgi:hypothetical protein
MKNLKLQSYGMIQMTNEEELNYCGGRNAVEQLIYDAGWWTGFILTISIKVAEETAKNILLDKIKK